MPKIDLELKHLPGEEVCFAMNVDGYLLPFSGIVRAVFPCCRESCYALPHETEYLVETLSGLRFRMSESMVSIARQVVAMCQDQNEQKLPKESK